MTLKRRAVSPVITTVILVAVAITLSVAVAYSMRPVDAATGGVTLHLGKMEKFGSYYYLYGGIDPYETWGTLHVSWSGTGRCYIGSMKLFEGDTVYLGSKLYKVSSIKADEIVLLREASD